MKKSKIRREVSQIDISNFLCYAKKPGRYSNNELNCKKKKISSKTLNFVLAFPDLYEVGMSHLGLKILYTILNREPNFAADRVYAPAQDFADILKKNSIPLFSIEDKIPIYQFDVVGFTLQYELSYTNILMILELSNIPILAEERGENSPLIIAGGPGAFNPEPLSLFFDAFVVGDGEDIILELANYLWRNKDADKNEKLLFLSKLKGIYIPKFYKQVKDSNGCYIVPKIREVPTKIEKNIFTDFDNLEKIHSPQLVPIIDVVHNRPSIEIMRGCTRGCRFCQAGMIYRPVRERDDKIVEQMVEREIQFTGWEEISLSSLSSSDYSAIEPLIINLNRKLLDTRTSLALPSLRIDAFDRKIAGLIAKLSGSSLTFAPEAGSQRMRDIINKQISEDDILESIKSAISIGLRSVKLYFMIGLPFEKEQDITSIVNLIEKIYNLHPHKALKINVSLSSFVPKSFTPFQWSAQDTKDNLLRKIFYIKNYFRGNKKVRIKYHSVEHSILEAVISRGDRRIGKLIYDAYLNGAKFDAWSESFDYHLWEKSAEKNNIDFDMYTGARKLNEKLCWSHIDCGVDNDFLKNEYKKSKNEEITPDCREGNCQSCGIDKKALPKYVKHKKVNIPIKIEQKIKGPDISAYQPIGLEPTFKFRIYYEKGDGLQFCSHRNLLNLIYKIIRRSGLPIYFTRGFSPRPKISLAPALPLGFIGQNEFFDISILRKVKESEIFEKLNFNLPKGFNLKKVEFLTSDSQKIADYQYELINIFSTKPFNWQDGILSFHSDITIFIKKRDREINLKNIIKNITLQKNGILVYKKISGAGVFDILENIFHYPMDRVHNLLIERIKIYSSLPQTTQSF